MKHFGVGLETINNKTLKLFNKGYKNDHVINLVEIGSRLPVSISIFMILYHPFTTLQEIYENYLFLKNIGYYDSKSKQRNGYDSLLQSRLLIRRYTKIENLIKKQELHRGFYKKNPFIVKYKFNNLKVENFWNELIVSCKENYNNVEEIFLETIKKYIKL